MTHSRRSSLPTPLPEVTGRALDLALRELCETRGLVELYEQRLADMREDVGTALLALHFLPSSPGSPERESIAAALRRLQQRLALQPRSAT